MKSVTVALQRLVFIKEAIVLQNERLMLLISRRLLGPRRTCLVNKFYTLTLEKNDLRKQNVTKPSADESRAEEKEELLREMMSDLLFPRLQLLNQRLDLLLLADCQLSTRFQFFLKLIKTRFTAILLQGQLLKTLLARLVIAFQLRNT